MESADTKAARRYRHSQKFERVVDAFTRMHEDNRTPDVLRQMARAAGVSPDVIDREIRIAESLFGHLVRRGTK